MISLTDFAPPSVPWDVSDAVILWAREHGREGGRVVWYGGSKCFAVEFDLKADDPRMKGWLEKRLKVKPKDVVFLHEPDGKGHYTALNIADLGVSGIVRLLDEGNLMSGTGRYKSLTAACNAVVEHNQKLEQAMEDAAVDNARLRARDDRRQILDLPTVSVPIDITRGSHEGS